MQYVFIQTIYKIWKNYLQNSWDMLRYYYRSENTYAKVLNCFFKYDIISISVEEKKEDFAMTKKVMRVVALLLAILIPCGVI